MKKYFGVSFIVSFSLAVLFSLWENPDYQVNFKSVNLVTEDEILFIDPQKETANFEVYAELKIDSAKLLNEISKKTNDDRKLSEKAHLYEKTIELLAAKHEVSPALIKGVIQAESNFNNKAQSSRGAVGLMQILPQTAKAMGVTQSHKPQENITAGVLYLKHLLKMFGDDEILAVAAYNCGPKRVKKSGVPSFKETEQFVDKVMGYYQYNLKS